VRIGLRRIKAAPAAHRLWPLMARKPQTHVALLRGVNVGGNKRVPMAEWRTLMEGLGYARVRTLLNSGNAVFDAAPSHQHAARIRQALIDGLGVDVAVIVKTAAEMAAIETENPLVAEATDASRLLVAFTATAEDLAGLAPLTALALPPERLHVGRHAAYLWCANGILESKAGAAMLGKAGRAATSRNWATVLKLLALVRSDAA
jgi:uncharacterized protein (DUF1697 family)